MEYAGRELSVSLKPSSFAAIFSDAVAIRGLGKRQSVARIKRETVLHDMNLIIRTLPEVPEYRRHGRKRPRRIGRDSRKTVVSRLSQVCQIFVNDEKEGITLRYLRDGYGALRECLPGTTGSGPWLLFATKVPVL